MQNRDIDPPAGTKSNQLEDDSIIKFAEEILSDPDDNIFELDDDENLNVENDDIIDLTDVAEKKLQSDDDILDLTEDIEIAPGSEDELLELEDITEDSTDIEETLSGLVDGNDDLTLLDDAVLDLDDVVEEISAVEQDLFAQEDAVDDEGSINSAEFMSEADTVELTETDRNALESEFGYEAPADNLTDPDTLHALTSDDIEEEILLDFSDDTTEDAIEEVDLAADLDEQSSEAPMVDGPHEKLKLTETDRRILEEELSLDTDRNIDAALIDDEIADDTNDTTEAVEDEIDPSLAKTPDPAESYRTEDAEPPAVEEVALNVADILALENDVTETEDIELDQDPVELEPEIPVKADRSQAVEKDHDRIAVISDNATDDSEPATDEALETDDSIDDFIFDLDETAAQPDAEANDIELPPLTAEEELSVEALLAEVESPKDSEQPHKSETGDEHPEMDADPDEKLVDIMPSDEKQTAADLDMDFNQVDATGGNDLHKTADPILIRVKEPPTANHPDEDALLNSVFEPEPEVDNLSSEQLEAAVERAVNKIFSERIESILFDAIDRAVTKEISRLKTLILGDSDQSD